MKFMTIGRFKSFKCIQHIYLLRPQYVSVIMLSNRKNKLSHNKLKEKSYMGRRNEMQGETEAKRRQERRRKRKREKQKAENKMADSPLRQIYYSL